MKESPVTLDHASLPPRLARGLLEMVSSLLCVVRGGTIIYMNSAGIRMLALQSSAELFGRPFEHFVNADYQFLMEAGLDLLAEESSFIPLMLVRQDGEPFEAEMTVGQMDGTDTYLVEARDISKFRRAAEALRDSEQRLQGILHTVAEGIVTIDQNGILQSVNPSAEQLFGYSRAEMVGQNVAMLMPEPDHSKHDSYLLRYMQTGKARILGSTREVMGLRKDGTQFPMDLTITELNHGKTRLFTGVCRDISERKKAEAEVKHLAHHDPLTGLPNRHLLNDRLTHALARAKRKTRHMAVLFIDLDRFKPINDTFGHEAGDVLLKVLAERFQRCLRESDTVARVGGDEFVIVLETIVSARDAARVAEKVLKTIGAPVAWRDQQLAVGTSIGIALFPQDGETPEELSKAADVAMYRVKGSGRNGFQFACDDCAREAGIL